MYIGSYRQRHPINAEYLLCPAIMCGPSLSRENGRPVQTCQTDAIPQDLLGRVKLISQNSMRQIGYWDTDYLSIVIRTTNHLSDLTYCCVLSRKSWFCILGLLDFAANPL